MQIALIGGTHGNEPVGKEVMNLFSNSKEQYKNIFSCFWGNPEAYQQQKRYVDTDLNRAFGKNGNRFGYELERVAHLEEKILGNFDFSIDLHTTTSNMGETVILNNTHPASRQIATYLQKQRPGLKIIEETQLDDECTHLNRLCPAGVTVELGPVANNVIDSQLLFNMHQIVELILNFDFKTYISLDSVEYYKMIDQINFPEKGGWYLHSDIDKHDFQILNPGQDIFINIHGETLKYSGHEPVYPFFINEAAYLEKRSAFLIAKKVKGFGDLD